MSRASKQALRVVVLVVVVVCDHGNTAAAAIETPENDEKYKIGGEGTKRTVEACCDPESRHFPMNVRECRTISRLFSRLEDGNENCITRGGFHQLNSRKQGTSGRIFSRRA